jgi:hypothetical protein
MPKRLRSGFVRRPARVVAPIIVNGFRRMVTTFACMPLSTVKSTLKSSIAG